MLTLEILRYRRFVFVKDAADALGVHTRVLRDWEIGWRQPRSKHRRKLEELFGRPWEALRRPAGRLGLPKTKSTSKEESA